MKLGLFASGGLGLTCVKDICRNGLDVSVIFSDGQSSEIIEYVEEIGIPLFVGNPRNGKGISFLEENKINIDLIVSINYLFIIENDLINYPKISAINFHGSLLPKYRGRTPHVWAIINNEKITGITAHVIESGCDEGPLIDQVKIDIKPEDTGGSLLQNFHLLYPAFVNKTIRLFNTEKVVGIPQDNTLATFFGKRTADSGRINWDWQRERINNWVRAQANPYPGAFCFYKGQKITIDKIEFSDVGFNYLDTNGQILESLPYPIIKTPNGAVSLTKIREELNLIKGECLY